MVLPLDQVIRVNVSRQTRTLSRRSFGMVMIAAFHEAWLDRSRTYSDPSEMLDDGFGVRHPAYLAAVSLCSQSPRCPQFKVGRRDGAPTQSVRFTPSPPVAGEVYTLTVGGVTFEVTADASPSEAEIIAAFVALMAADVDAIITTGVSAAAPQTYAPNGLDGDLDGVIGDDAFAPARNLTFTLSAHADWNATTIVVTGLDQNGRTITESFIVPDGGGVTLTGTRVFSQVLSVSVPAQGAGGGTFTMGVGVLFANEDLDVTATDGGTYLQIAADDLGAWFSFTDVSSNLAIEDVTAEPATTLAEDLTAIQAEDSDFYGLIVADAQSAAQIEKVAAWAETQTLVYVAHCWDAACELDGEDDILSTLRDEGYQRSKGFYSRANHGAFPDAAILGRIFPIFDQGPLTPDWDYKALVGIVTDDLSTDAINILTGTPEQPFSGKNAMLYVELRATGANAGTGITWGGQTPGSDWIDATMAIDFSTAEVQAAAIQPRLTMPRVPFTEEGADLARGCVRAALLKCSRAPYQIFDEATLIVEATPVAEIDAATRQTRYYTAVTYDARLTGAMRGLRVNGTVRP
jgi:hypothetical protein